MLTGSRLKDKEPGLEVIFSMLNSMKFILLINVKVSTFFDILTFISMINKHLRDLKQKFYVSAL